jgi:hypothetical protein
MSEFENAGAPVQLRSDRVEFVDVGGEVVVLDAVQLLYYSVNESGAHLWAALRAGATPAELRRVLIENHGVSEDQAAADVAAFLEQLDSAGLLESNAG